MIKVPVLGVGTTKFGELWDVSPRVLVKEAVDEALKDAGLKIEQIDALYVGNMLSGILGNQENLGALFAEELGVKNIPAFKIEGACASGGLAVHNAVNSLLGGIYKTVLVVGIEKMTDHNPAEIAQALMAGGHDEERAAGVTFPGLYAILAKAYMEKFGVTEEELAAVAVKNHYHASLNPKAQFPFIISLAQVMDSAPVAEPLKLLDCSPVSDGAAAVILSSNIKAPSSKKTVYITASSVATDSLGLRGRKELISLKAASEAAKKAYLQAGVKPSEVDVAEVHDCFTIAEILACEDLGFFPKGKAAQEIAKGKTRLEKGHPIVNTSGGLKACGHPVGATGVKQMAEIVTQLRGQAGKRQVKGAKIGLTHNVGGSGAVAVVHILSNYD